ncbi:type II secretion system protein GspL [Sideroxydans lithotrophicus]|uniref:General secretion pathway L n=1 Tax=Sideroxydans lithotrophicus (strain ES-1) TaxID=580332 RepID=D5CMB7_SIDLE|nr:type II secretion system protein GspL [Sideroxydans lithotrophicus]ADE10731.1 General secretion pathway L [Sideroxydans lithotrophicus ES-1]
MNLRIHLTAHWQDAASPCDWSVLDDTGNVRESGNGNLAAMPQCDDATVIVAADRVLATAAALPRIKRSKLETALPFALEDILIDDASEAHVTPGTKLPDGRSVLYAVNKDWLSRFLAASTAARIRVRRIVPEFCLLPTRTNEWSLAWDGAQGFLATADHLGGMLDSGSEVRAPAALQLRLQQGAPAALRLFALGSEIRQPDWGIKVPVIYEKQSFDWRKADIPADAPNLLWGKFAPPPRISELWPWLRPALMAALLLFGVEVAVSNVEWAMLAHEKRQLMNGMTETFRETFGADAVIVDAPLQMRRNVARLRHAAGVGDDADFSPLLEKLSGVLDAVPGSTLRTLRYGEGKLDIEMALASASALDTLLQRIAATGLTAQVLDKRDSGGVLNIQLRISTGGAQ